MIRSFRNQVRVLFCIFAYLHIGSFLFSQTKYPQRYFRNPLDIPMELVANFGELRTNHWHMGLDIRTGGKVNLPVHAAADGYIAYVGVRPLSFGKFIIINHPNGYSTLYAHLNDFFPALSQYVLDQQAKNESWAIELKFTKDQFKISKGQFIAYSGTTGASEGPHLHFEIRETKTDRSLNPLLFGMPVQDDVPPNLYKLAMYDRGISVYEQEPKLFALKKTGDSYEIPKMPAIKTGFSKLSFAINAVDKISGSQNPNGIYTARLFKDNELISEFVLDQVDYAESEYINAQIDYRFYKAGRGYLQHLSPLPGDKQMVYHVYNSDGLVHLDDTLLHNIKIEVGDAANNISTVNFQIQYNEELKKQYPGRFTHTEFIPNYVSVLEKPDFEAYLPEACIYDTIQQVYYRSNATVSNAVSALHQLNDNSYPVHEPLTIRIKPTVPIKSEWRNKIVIQRNGNNAILKPEWEGEWLSVKSGAFGTFQALVDLTPPQLNSIGNADTVNLSPASRIVFVPNDNSGIKNFSAELDDKWLMFTNDKGRSWIYNFDERCPYGTHHLRVTVEDLVGNTTTKEWWFKKYPYTPPPKKKKKGKPPVPLKGKLKLKKSYKKK